MERSTLRQIRLALRSLGRRRLNRRYTFTDATILEVYLFAVLHERPVSWQLATRPTPRPDAQRLDYLQTHAHRTPRCAL